MRALGILIIGMCLAAHAQEPAAEGPGLAERASELRSELLAIESPDIPAQADGSLALAKLHLERAERMLMGEAHDWALDPASELDAAQTALEWFRQGAPPHQGIRGESLTFAYEAENDGSCQPFWVYVPSGYDPGESWPLIVYLHGWVPETSKLVPWTVMDLVGELCEEYGFIFLQPHGRGNTDFQGVGELDVLRAIDETMSLYNVDPSRIHMAGNSMGGYGAYCIALHHPDRFASLAVGCGQSDYYDWYGLDRDQVPDFKRYMYSLSNPVDWMENALHLPVLIQHGERDPLVPPRQSQFAADRLAALGYEHELHFMPGGPHEIYLTEDYFHRLMGFCRGKRRVEEPRRVRFVTYNLEFDRAYWLRVTGIERWGERADVEAAASAGRIDVECANVTGLRLDPPPALVGDGEVRIIINGEEHNWDGQAPFDWGAPSGLGKAHGRAGPIRKVLERPFLCVYNPRDEESAALLARFSVEWWRFAEGLPWVSAMADGWPEGWAVADTEITDELMNDHNLVLFGRPESNAVLAEMADQLPAEFIDGGFRIGGQDLAGEDLGMWLCYPSPVGVDRMVLVISGHPWGDGFRSAGRVDHKLDLLPDFIVFDSTIRPDDNNRYRAAGVFGPDWGIQTLNLSPAETRAEQEPQP
ncbi:MAG: prolyl oligopeptidase family serine peptidase [Armatimonadia bacterium]|nr:prolyl oligopeptidase family serine peptidase [Armatimonadia bacterium]